MQTPLGSCAFEPNGASWQIMRTRQPLRHLPGAVRQNRVRLSRTKDLLKVVWCSLSFIATYQVQAIANPSLQITKQRWLDC